MTVSHGASAAFQTVPDENISLDSAPDNTLDRVIEDAAEKLRTLQKNDGHWLFELEADATIPAEYIMLEHYLDEIDQPLHEEMAKYLRRIQNEDGGWPLFYKGDFDISATVKAYYALKMVGDDIDAPHMAKARALILSHGGAARTNVFTRIALALFGQVPWRAVPVMPMEIMLLPKWFPFHLSKVSYWSRTVIVPLLILMALKPQARNPRGIDIRELFVTPPEDEKNYNRSATDSAIAKTFLVIDAVLRRIEPRSKGRLRATSIRKALDFINERLNGEDGLGGIFPAMANTVMAFDALGYDKDDEDLVTAKAAVRKLVVRNGDDGQTYCQPCMSPVWDTGLAMQALMEADREHDNETALKAGDWLKDRQILDVVGDYAWSRPDARPGGWAFEYWNDHYPDVDDTAVVAIALERTGDPKYREAIDRAAEWIEGMQCKNGGWGSFDADNEYYYLNHIPFADHGALLDPPTEDVTARCLSFLAQIGYKSDHPAVARGIEYLKRTQMDDGSWYGRWGTNYVYGTWSALCALNACGEDLKAPYVRRAVDWLKSRQQADGGWGEDGGTYYDETRDLTKASTPSQTAWAMLALMAAGEVDDESVERGAGYLVEQPREGANWVEPWYTAVGFPKVFYLRYHGYSAYFPLWALARYRNLKAANDTTVGFGM